MHIPEILQWTFFVLEVNLPAFCWQLEISLRKAGRSLSKISWGVCWQGHLLKRPRRASWMTTSITLLPRMSHKLLALRQSVPLLAQHTLFLDLVPSSKLQCVLKLIMSWSTLHCACSIHTWIMWYIVRDWEKIGHTSSIIFLLWYTQAPSVHRTNLLNPSFCIICSRVDW